MLQKLSVFCDFDGTITTVDTGDAFFEEFAPDFEQSMLRLVHGYDTVREYYKRVVSSINCSLSNDVLNHFAQRFPIDSNFKQFVQFCTEMSFPLTIVSDGFKEYIKEILQYNGLEHIPYFANKMTNTYPLQPIFPFASESCTCFCASCKRNIVMEQTPPEHLIVYIGDGHSDMCAASHADIIFAKGALASYCSTERIPHYPYRTFFDVMRLMKSGIEQKKFRSRHQAALLRKKAYETE